jgi:hypothetical protein
MLCGVARHTSENIATWLAKTFAEYEITDKLWSCTADGAAAQQKAIEEVKSIHVYTLWCACHRLHLVVMDALKHTKVSRIRLFKLMNSKIICFSLQNVAKMIRKFRSVVVGIRASSLRTNELKAVNEAQQMPQRKLSLDVVTRWNSTYEMLKRVDESRYGIESLGYQPVDDPKQNIDELWMGNDPTEPPSAVANLKEDVELSHTDWDMLGNLLLVSSYTTSR